MIEQADFYETHIFKYSRRQGTRADRMENQVPEQIKNREKSCTYCSWKRAYEKIYGSVYGTGSGNSF